MTSFLLLVLTLWLGGIVFVGVCMAIVKALGWLEDNYE
jgi:hypothetical protein